MQFEKEYHGRRNQRLDLQRVCLKTDFASIVIPLSTRVNKFPENCPSIFGKWKGKTSRNQSCSGQWSIMSNSMQTGATCA